MRKIPLLGSILKASGARGAALVSSLVFTAFASRIVFNTYGAEAYGVVTFIASLQYLIPFADLGLGAIIMNRVAEARANGNIRHAYQTIYRSVKIQAFLALCLALALIAWSFTTGPSVIIGRDTSIPTVAIVTAGLVIFANVPASFGNRVLIGLNLTHLSIFMSAIAPPLVLGLVLICSHLSLDAGFLYPIWPIAALASSLAISAVASRSIGVSFFRMVDGLSLTKIRNKAEPIWSTALSMLVISIASPLTHNSHRVILGAVATTQALATYSLGAQIFSPLLSLLTSAATPLWSAFASKKGTNRTLLTTTAGFGVVGLLSAGSLFLAVPLYCWFVTGSNSYVPWELTASFALFLTVNAFTLPSMMRMNKGSGIKFQAWAAAIACLAGLPFSVWAATQWGAQGPVVASACVMVIIQLAPMLAWQLKYKRE